MSDPKEIVEEAVKACGNEPADIDACIALIRPHIEPYFQEGEFESRFAPSFHTMMQSALPTKHLQAVQFVKQLMNGPTRAEQLERIQKEREKQEAEHRALVDGATTELVQVVLQRLGLRKGDKLVVHRDGLIYIDPADLGIELPDAEESDTEEPDPS